MSENKPSVDVSELPDHGGAQLEKSPDTSPYSAWPIVWLFLALVVWFVAVIMVIVP